MTKEEILEEAEYLIKTNEGAKESFDRANELQLGFEMKLPEVFDNLYFGLSKSNTYLIGFWYSRATNPNRPKG